MLHKHHNKSIFLMFTMIVSGCGRANAAANDLEYKLIVSKNTGLINETPECLVVLTNNGKSERMVGHRYGYPMIYLMRVQEGSIIRQEAPIVPIRDPIYFISPQKLLHGHKIIWRVPAAGVAKVMEGVEGNTSTTLIAAVAIYENGGFTPMLSSTQTIRVDSLNEDQENILNSYCKQVNVKKDWHCLTSRKANLSSAAKMPWSFVKDTILRRSFFNIAAHRKYYASHGHKLSDQEDKDLSRALRGIFDKTGKDRFKSVWKIYEEQRKTDLSLIDDSELTRLFDENVSLKDLFSVLFNGQSLDKIGVPVNSLQYISGGGSVLVDEKGTFVRTPMAVAIDDEFRDNWQQMVGNLHKKIKDMVSRIQKKEISGTGKGVER